jgi:hypothetical protein
MKDQFIIPARLKTWSLILIGVGVVTLLGGLIWLHPFDQGSTQNYGTTRFWAVLIQNSTFFFLVSVAAFFFIVAHTLAMGGWQTALRRVPEALSGYMYVGGIILLLVFAGYFLLTKDHYIYTWKTPGNDKELLRKHGFQNPTFFFVASIIFMGAWMLARTLYRKNSIAEDNGAFGDRSYFKKAITICAVFAVFYAVGISSAPSWLWLMSIDAKWSSTMYGWYTFASTWVSALSFIALFVIYLKNQGKLEYVNEEHLHDLGKFMFAFSIFWTYLWFAQYMLTWYANIPDETTYFGIRLWGSFRPIFLLNLIINFVCPILILMTKDSKRSWTVVTFMAVLIIFGHWLDFYQMVMPGPLKDHAQLGLFEFGILAGFVGTVIFVTAKCLEKASLTPKNSPFLKESIIHHT